MTDLSSQLTSLVSDAFQSLELDASKAAVQRSNRPDLGDFQCNGALAVAKQARQNPLALANQVVEKLATRELFDKIAVAPPGFINFTLSDQTLAARAEQLSQDPRSGVSPAPTSLRVLVDFAGPNVAKPMHVGHLRATILGDSLQRIARFLGHQVTSDAHFGDWGLQIGLLIVQLQEEQPDLPYFRSDYDESMNQAEPPVTMADLDRMYPLASARKNEDKEFLDRARKATAELQKGRPGYLALHKHFWKVSQFSLEREFTALNIHFDLWKGESDVNYLIEELVEDCRSRGIAQPSEGALVINVVRPDENREVPPLLLVSSEGSAMYGTTDLATIVERQRSLDPEVYLYCVDQRQSLHFVQVFRAAAAAGYCSEERLEHIGFGTMNGTDGKPFKTRSGGVVRLHELITNCREKALERMEQEGKATDLSPEEKERTALMVGTAALKFADLVNHRLTDYIFDFDRFTAFEGKTGPYLQMQGVRCKSVLNKAGEVPEGPVRITVPAERELILVLDAFHAAVHLAFEKRSPNFVAEHIYTVGKAFATFWEFAPVLSCPEPEVRASRLRLVQATLRQLEVGLGLLGIEIPEKM